MGIDGINDDRFEKSFYKEIIVTSCSCEFVFYLLLSYKTVNLTINREFQLILRNLYFCVSFY